MDDSKKKNLSSLISNSNLQGSEINLSNKNNILPENHEKKLVINSPPTDSMGHEEVGSKFPKNTKNIKINRKVSIESEKNEENFLSKINKKKFVIK